MEKATRIRGQLRTTFQNIWCWLRYILLVLILSILIMLLMAIVDTPFWTVLEALLVPIMLVFIAAWLNQQEAQRQKAERIDRERKQIEIDYQLGLAQLETRNRREKLSAAAELDARTIAALKNAYNDDKRLLEKRRDLRLADLENSE